MIQAIGFAAMLSSLIGMLCLARENDVGWLLRLGAGTGWITYGLATKAYPVLAMSLIHLVIDAYAVIRRWRAKRCK